MFHNIGKELQEIINIHLVFFHVCGSREKFWTFHIFDPPMKFQLSKVINFTIKAVGFIVLVCIFCIKVWTLIIRYLLVFNDYLTELFTYVLQSFEYLFTYQGIFSWFRWRSFYFHLISKQLLVCYIDCKYHV